MPGREPDERALDDLDHRISSALSDEPTPPSPTFLGAVARRRRARRTRAGALAAAVLIVGLGASVYLTSPSSVESPADPDPIDRPPTARADRPSFGVLASNPEWLSGSVSLVGFATSRGDEPPYTLRMAREEAAIDRVFERMSPHLVSGS
jgi:hypothetical protein